MSFIGSWEIYLLKFFWGKSNLSFYLTKSTKFNKENLSNLDVLKRGNVFQPTRTQQNNEYANFGSLMGVKRWHQYEFTLYEGNVYELKFDQESQVSRSL